jgi:hypothetical protein
MPTTSKQETPPEGYEIPVPAFRVSRRWYSRWRPRWQAEGPSGLRYEYSAPGAMVHADTKKLGRIVAIGHGRPRFSLRALRLARPPQRACDGLPVAVRLPSGSGDAADRRLAGAARREPARVAEVCARYPVLSDRQMRAGRSVSPSNSSPCCRRSFVVSGRGLMSQFSSWSLALLRIARPERTASPPRS